MTKVAYWFLNKAQNDYIRMGSVLMEKTFSPKVSIVIPIYNGEDYMKEAVESAIAQTYGNLEIILVNDGSKDNTHSICEAYQNKYPKLIKYKKKENGGVSTALNLAIENMTGDYFSWLSHDDVYFPEKVETQVDILNGLIEEGKDIKKIILYSNYGFINDKGEHITNVVFDSALLNKKPAYSLLRGSINGLTLFIPKEAFDTIGTFDESKHTTQDYDLWMRFIRNGYVFYHHKNVLTKTRLHKNQTTNTSSVLAKECDELWINMCEMLNNSEKEKLDGSLYNYYNNMYTFLKTHTNYEGACKYCENKLNEIKNKKEYEITKNPILVTVVITYYNESEEKLERAIASLLSQTYSNIGVLIINDSGDSENAVLNNLFNKYKDSLNIKLIHNEENKGVSYSRNVGISNAKGKYIAFLDCDDEFLPEKLEKQVYEMELSNAVFSHTSYIRVVDSDELLADSAKFNSSGNKNIIYDCQIVSSTVMINKELVGDIRYREDLTISGDWVFYLELFRKSENYISIEEPLSKAYYIDSSDYNYDNLINSAGNVLYCLVEKNYYRDYLYEFLLFTNHYKNILDYRCKAKNDTNVSTNYNNKTLLEKAIYQYRMNGFWHLVRAVFRKVFKAIKRQD